MTDADLHWKVCKVRNINDISDRQIYLFVGKCDATTPHGIVVAPHVVYYLSKYDLFFRRHSWYLYTESVL